MSIVDSERALEHLATILETDDVRLLQEFIRSIDEQDLAIVARKAAAFGATRSLSALLECGVDVNSEWHGSLIRVAAQRGKLDAVHLLIDRGADIDSDNPLLDATVGRNRRSRREQRQSGDEEYGDSSGRHGGLVAGNALNGG